MQTVKRIGGGILFGSMVFLLFLVAFESFLHIPSWLAVAGRLHPMFLHFPIVLLLTSLFTLWIAVNKDGENEWLTLLRLVAALSAVITAILGMLLSLEDAGEGDLLDAGMVDDGLTRFGTARHDIDDALRHSGTFADFRK